MAEIKYLDLNGLKALYGVVDGKITTAVNDAKTELKGTATTDGDTLGKLEGKIKSEVTRATAAETALSDRLGALESGDNSVGAQINAAVTGLKNGASEGYDTLKGLEDKIKEEATRADTAEKANAAAIAAMDLNDTAVDGEFITTVSQSDGKVAIARGKVASDKVTAVAVSGGADTVAIAGTTVDAQIKSLGRTLKTVEGNAAKYKVVKLSADEVTALNDANVKEAYKVVSYVGADAQGTAYTQVGEVIKIYKDGNLKSATLGDDQKLILTYTTTEGKDATVEVDFAAIAFNAEFKNGLQVAENGEISVQVDAASESFLTVGEGGVKLAGVKKAIDAAVAAKNVSAQGDEYITATAAGNTVSVSADVQSLTVNKSAGADSTIAGVAKSLVDGAEVATKVAAFTNARISEEIAKLDATVGEAAVAAGKHVAVQVVETDGKITAVNVNEKDIASKTALDAEIDRATKAEAKALADAKAYTDGQFTGRTTIAQYGITDAKIEGQTITLGNVQLQFVAYTAKEIQDAANPAAGK